MNPRERRLLIALVTVVGVGGLGGGTYGWFVKPFIAYNKAIAAARGERDIEALKWSTFEEERKKLEWARLKSLPIKSEDAASEYQNYLERTIARTGLKLTNINSAQAVKVKPASQIGNVKEVGHLLLSFTLAARGELADVIKFMEIVQSTPYEHRIKSLSVDRADGSYGKNASKALTVNMTIEAFLVAKNENKPGHPPGVDPKYMVYDHIAARSQLAPMGWGVIGSMVALKQAYPTPVDRRYADIALKNIFVGYIPLKRSDPPPPDDDDPKGPEYPGNIPEYIRLVHTVPSHQEAYLSNLFYKKEEIRLSSDPNTGYQLARIADIDGEYIFFRMKVLRIDSGVVYFQVKKSIYKITLGQTLDSAIQSPVRIEDWGALDIEPDFEWAKEQMKSEQKIEKTKTPTKKTFKKGG